MTSRESFDSNAAEGDAIVMEISNPNFMVLPIPENRRNANTTVQLGICITNNTSTGFRLDPYGTLIPELVASDGQALQRQIATDEPVASILPNTSVLPGWGSRLIWFLSNSVLPLEHRETREINYLLVSPRDSNSVSLTGRLSWQNNLLKFKVSTIPDCFQDYTSPGSNTFWSFDALQPETYQLRFIYDSNRRTRPGFEIDMGEEKSTVQKIGSGQLATPFVNLRLVQPVEPDRSAVEVDGIRFETVVPERPLTVPKKNMVLKLLYILKNSLLPTTLRPPSLRASVPIGIRITNNTYTTLKFSFYFTLFPEIVGAEGEIPLGGGWISPTAPLKSDFLSAKPGESVTFFPDIEIFWFWGNQFGLSIATGNGGTWIFKPLKLGTYKFRFTYNNPKAVETMYDSVSTDIQLIEGLWTGVIYTPFVEFRLVQP